MAAFYTVTLQFRFVGSLNNFLPSRFVLRTEDLIHQEISGETSGDLISGTKHCQPIKPMVHLHDVLLDVQIRH